MTSFPCHSCGHCCRHLRGILQDLSGGAGLPAMQQAAAAFPYPVDAAGACTQLRADNSCAVYQTRPDLCSVDRMFDLLSIAGLSRADWYAMNAAHCPAPTILSSDAGIAQ